MSQTEIKLYTMTHCPYCVKAKSLLSSRGLTFQEIKVSEDDDAEWDRLEKMSGMKTVPQIWFGSKLVGGYSDLEAMDRAEKLSPDSVAKFVG